MVFQVLLTGRLGPTSYAFPAIPGLVPAVVFYPFSFKQPERHSDPRNGPHATTDADRGVSFFAGCCGGTEAA